MIPICKNTLLFLIQLMLLLLSSPVGAQSLSLASDADGVSTLQSVTLNSTSCHFDPDLTLIGSQTCGWKATLNNTNNGAVFQIRCGAL
ncbi:MAG: hypothetical protein K2X81_00395, partial [Candidatus Obscuribacterales bacterium]|nr:hypothetical protein [Candidatus Obscuribacterales bacterium]